MGASAPLVQRIDHLIFVETDIALCLARRITRDVAERGRSEQSVRQFWTERVAPMYEQYGDPIAALANTRISGELAIEEMVQVVVSAIGDGR